MSNGNEDIMNFKLSSDGVSAAWNANNPFSGKLNSDGTVATELYSGNEASTIKVNEELLELSKNMKEATELIKEAKGKYEDILSRVQSNYSGESDEVIAKYKESLASKLKNLSDLYAESSALLYLTYDRFEKLDSKK